MMMKTIKEPIDLRIIHGVIYILSSLLLGMLELIVVAAIIAAVAAEREACAKIIESYGNSNLGSNPAAVKEIRARSSPSISPHTPAS